MAKDGGSKKTRARKRIRFPIWAKITLSCLVLSELVVAVMYLQARHAAAIKDDRGNFLEPHYKHYAAYTNGQGRALASVAQIIAADDDVEEQLAHGLGANADVVVDPTLVPPAPGTPAIKGHARIDTVLREVADALSDDSAIQPDIFIIVDTQGNAIVPANSPIKAEEVHEILPAKNAREGSFFPHEILVYEGVSYLVAGVPVKLGGKLVGGVVLGSKLERFLEEYSRQSDDDEAARDHLVLIAKDGEVLATSMHDKKSELKQGMRSDAWINVTEGKRTIKAALIDGKAYDFFRQPISGFSGQNAGEIGNLFLIRSRAGHKTGLEGLWQIALAASVLSLVVSLVLAWVITRPIKRFIEATDDILSEGGDLSRRVDIDCSDELDDLAQNMNRLFDNLHRLAKEVSQASFQVGASSAEISAASKQMLEGVKDQAVKVESSTAAVTELSSSIQQVAANAIEATKAAQQTNTAVEAAMGSMNQIRSTVEEASEKIQQLGESGKRIGNIVEVIRQISEQTSLLALNASIEAAHAGEQGRGFAVVADEVSSLARRVGQSAKDIEDLIATIKDQTSDAVRTMQAGTKEVEGGTALVTNTLSNLKHIIDAVEDTANAVQEQALVSDEIARNMDHVQKIAQEVLAGSEEAVIQGEQLHALAHNLEESVRGFNLDGELPVAAPRAPVPRLITSRARDSAPRSSPPAPRRPAKPTSKPVDKDASGETEA